MNICLMIYGELDQVSGGYLYDREMVEILRKRGAREEIISLPAGSYALHLTENIFGVLPRVLQKLRPDVLIQDELCHPSLFHCNGTLKKTLNCPVISIVHHLLSSEFRPAWRNNLYRLVEKRYLATVDGFIFNSETTRGVILNLLGMDGTSFVAYPGGDHLNPDIDAPRIVERCGGPGPLKKLFVGNVIPRKGLHELIGALGSLPRRTWRLTVAGNFADDTGYADRIRNLIARAGLSEQVALLGTVSDEKLAALLKDHHCLAVPSFYEGFGIVYLEAMAFGLPVIATRSGAIPEVVADGREGFLVPPGDKVALADRVGLLIRDRNLLAAMSLAARKGQGAYAAFFRI